MSTTESRWKKQTAARGLAFENAASVVAATHPNVIFYHEQIDMYIYAPNLIIASLDIACISYAMIRLPETALSPAAPRPGLHAEVSLHRGRQERRP